jgi:hypothetical protein
MVATAAASLAIPPGTAAPRPSTDHQVTLGRRLSRATNTKGAPAALLVLQIPHRARSSTRSRLIQNPARDHAPTARRYEARSLRLVVDPDPRRYLRRPERVAARGGAACPGRGRASDARSARRGVRSHASRAIRRGPAGRVRPAARGGRRRRPPREPQDAAVRDGRGRLARPAAAHCRADPADLERARRAFAATRRTPVRADDPGHEARCDPRLGSRQQPRAARAVQRGRARALPRPLAALELKTRASPPSGACLG